MVTADLLTGLSFGVVDSSIVGLGVVDVEVVVGTSVDMAVCLSSLRMNLFFLVAFDGSLGSGAIRLG